MADPDATMPAKKPTSPGKVVFWCFLALLVLLLVYEFFDIQKNCFQYTIMKSWQSNFCSAGK